MENLSKDITKLTFEEAMNQLEQIVKELEIGKGSLNDSIEKYQKAHYLKSYCLEKLNQAKLTVEKIIEENDNSISLIKENIDYK